MALKGHIKFQKKLDRIAGVAEAKALWGRIGFQAIDVINQRTLKGKDVDGVNFKGYSKKAYFFKIKGKYRTLDGGYEEFKKIRGGKHGSKVNLNLNGHMLASMKYKATRKNVTLTFSKTQEAKKAFIHHNGEGKMPKREFFDLSPMERKQMGKLAAKELRKLING